MEKQPIIAIDRLTGKLYGTPDEKENESAPLSDETVQTIYSQARDARWMPKWIYDEQGNKIGYERISIDAWYE